MALHLTSLMTSTILPNNTQCDLGLGNSASDSIKSSFLRERETHTHTYTHIEVVNLMGLGDAEMVWKRLLATPGDTTRRRSPWRNPSTMWFDSSARPPSSNFLLPKFQDEIAAWNRSHNGVIPSSNTNVGIYALDCKVVVLHFSIITKGGWYFLWK